MKFVKGHFSYSLIMRGSFALLSFLSIVAMARYFGPELMGEYSFLMACFSLLLIPFTTGIARFNVRYVAKDLTKAKYRALKILAEECYLVFILSLLCLILVVLLFLLEVDTAYILLTFLFPVAVLINAEMSLLRGLGHYKLGNLDGMILRPIFFLIGILGMNFFKVEMSITSLAILFCSVYILSRVVLMPFMKWQNFRATTKLKIISTRKIRFMIGMLTVVGAVDVLALNLDVFILASVSNMPQVANFKIAATIKTLALLPVQSFNLFLPAILAPLSNQPPSFELGNTVKKLISINILFLLVFCVLFLIFGDFFISKIFGDQYTDTFVITLPFILAIVIAGLCGPSVETLVGLGGEKILLFITLLSITVSVILNISLSPKIGGLGASIASSVGYVMLFVISAVYVKVRYKIDTSVLLFLKK